MRVLLAAVLLGGCALGADPTMTDNDGLTAYDYAHARDGKDPERHPVMQLVKIKQDN